MKKLASFIALAQIAVFAQTGLLGGGTGLHQQDANTIGILHFRAGMGGTIATDNWGYSRAGQFTDSRGRTRQFEAWDGLGSGRIDGALTGNINFAFGLRDNVDIGVSLPIYYDHAKDSSGRAIRANMDEGGLGDLQFYAKYGIPHFGPEYLTTAAVLDLTIPTGWTGVGTRPRHAWFLNSDGGTTDAYTSNSFMVGITGIATLDYTKIGVPVIWNTSIGVMVGIGDASNTLVYSTGVNYVLNDWVQPFLEFSGEMRFGSDAYPFSPMDDPMLLTPGFNFRVPNLHLDFAAGIDIGIKNMIDGYDKKDALDGCEDMQIRHKGKSGSEVTYCYVAHPLIAGVAKLTWTFGYMGDEDNDGIKDNKDMCPKTPKGATIDSTGCPFDTDKDAVLDGLDKCVDTPVGATVDSIGCPSDADKDNVFDGIDKCADTPEGATVDSVGCPSDADKDNVFDGIDKCADTPVGATVDSVGCPSDADTDNVFDGIDKCADTPVGATVDSVGCPSDADKDGVFDGIDKCDKTPEGAPIDSVGCPLDTDKDGVFDYMDACPNTLPGINVNHRGCPLRKKEDLDQLKKGIQFEFGSAKLLKSSYPTLDDIISLLMKIPEVKLEVQGHTDIVGTEDFNQKLSEDRANAVADYFKLKGVPADRVRAIGFGTRMPLGDNETEEGRAKNRRVELIPFGYHTENDDIMGAPSDLLKKDQEEQPQ